MDLKTTDKSVMVSLGYHSYTLREMHSVQEMGREGRIDDREMYANFMSHCIAPVSHYRKEDQVVVPNGGNDLSTVYVGLLIY